MLAEALKYRAVLSAGVLPPLLVFIYFAISSWNRPSLEIASAPTDQRLRGIDSLESLKSSLAKDREMLAGHEREQATLREEVVRRRKAFQLGEMTASEVAEAEKAFVLVLRKLHDMRHSVDEADIAITEAMLGEKVLRAPLSGGNGFRETAELAHLYGHGKWSLREAPRLEKYFSQTFGRRLPVTAMGQSTIHSRLGLDHREAMDVALHPDSREGKALMEHLRKSGIPFTAFRSSVPGASTGAHIHVGEPSGRLRRNWN